MSKYGIRGGHNAQAPGADGIIDELTEDRLVKNAVIKYLKLAGETIIDCTPPNSSEEVDLEFGTGTANDNKVDLFVPIHFNSCVAVNGAVGSEVWLNPKNPQGVVIANRILANLHALGFINRGLKDGTSTEHLHDILDSNMTATLVEVCFVNSAQDVAIYRKIGFDKVGKVIAEGIIGKTIAEPVAEVVSKPVVVAPVESKVNAGILALQKFLNAEKYTDSANKILVEDGEDGTCTKEAFEKLVKTV